MYTMKAYGYNSLWNVAPSEDPISPTDILIRNTSTAKTAFGYIPGYKADVIITGEFSIPWDAIDASSITGTMDSRKFIVDGITLQTEYWSTPIDVTRYDFAYELEQIAGDDWFEGSASLAVRDFIQGLGGDDTFKGHGDDSFGDFFYGGSGIDTAIFDGAFAQYKLEQVSDIWDYRTDANPRVSGYRVTDNTQNRDGIDNLNEVERLQFSDLSVALDSAKGENAGDAYRLYKAAFDRAPDTEGLGFWIKQLDNGASLVHDAAQGFINSVEFAKMYGTNPTDETFITLLYDHVLHRAAEGDGYQFWLHSLDVGVSRAQVLVDFANSTENISQTSTLIANGILYEEFLN